MAGLGDALQAAALSAQLVNQTKDVQAWNNGPSSPSTLTPSSSSSITGLEKLNGGSNASWGGGNALETLIANKQANQNQPGSNVTQVPQLSDIPQINREDYMTEGGPGFGDYLGHIAKGPFAEEPWKKGAVHGTMRLDKNGKAQYLQAKLGRLTQVAQLSGLSPQEAEGVRQQAIYSLSQTPKTDEDGEALDDEAALAAAEGVINDIESQYAQIAIQSTAGGMAAEEQIPGSYTPQQQLAIQKQIQEFITPYADAAAMNGTNVSNILNELAGQNPSPAYQGLIRSQAATAAQSGANLANAYAQQAAVLPAIAALEAQRQQQAQIASLQNQLLAQQQSGASAGAGDFDAMLQQLTGGQ